VNVRLHELRQVLDDKTLKNLLDRNYDPDATVAVHMSFEKTKLIEDCFIPTQRPRAAQKVIKKIMSPSETAMNLIDDTSDVLYAYFAAYKRLFGEEDAEWSSTSMSKAVYIIKTFRHSTGVSNEDIVAFITKILPLWVSRLRSNETFPGSRPTLRALFEGKRYYWINRNLLYRQWAPK
jgi:hypothetical protein